MDGWMNWMTEWGWLWDQTANSSARPNYFDSSWDLNSTVMNNWRAVQCSVVHQLQFKESISHAIHPQRNHSQRHLLRAIKSKMNQRRGVNWTTLQFVICINQYCKRNSISHSHCDTLNDQKYEIYRDPEWTLMVIIVIKSNWNRVGRSINFCQITGSPLWSSSRGLIFESIQL